MTDRPRPTMPTPAKGPPEGEDTGDILIPRDPTFERLIDTLIPPPESPRLTLLEVVEQTAGIVMVRPQAGTAMDPMVAYAGRHFRADPGDLAIGIRPAGSNIFYLIDTVADPDEAALSDAIPEHHHEGEGGNSVAIGTNAVAPAVNAVALGREANAVGESAVAVGGFASADGSDAVAMGEWAEAPGVLATAIGADSHATGPYGTALGAQARAGDRGVAVGINAEALALRSIAIGRDTHVADTEPDVGVLKANWFRFVPSNPATSSNRSELYLTDESGNLRSLWINNTGRLVVDGLGQQSDTINSRIDTNLTMSTVGGYGRHWVEYSTVAGKHYSILFIYQAQARGNGTAGAMQLGLELSGTGYTMVSSSIESRSLLSNEDGTLLLVWPFWFTGSGSNLLINAYMYLNSGSVLVHNSQLSGLVGPG